MSPRGQYIRKSPIERFCEKISISSSGCWEWQGATNGAGYGRIDTISGTMRVHRFSYEWFRAASIPMELTIDHLCRNRKCVNPDHLEVVTNRENILRGVGPSALNKKKTCCPWGHIYYVTKQGYRTCKICAHNNHARWRKLPDVYKKRRLYHQQEKWREYGQLYYGKNKERLLARQRELYHNKKQQLSVSRTYPIGISESTC